MRTVLAALALLTIAGPALADDVATLEGDATVEGVDPSVDGTRTVDARVFVDDAGAPGAEVLVDGQSVLP